MFKFFKKKKKKENPKNDQLSNKKSKPKQLTLTPLITRSWKQLEQQTQTQTETETNSTKIKITIATQNILADKFVSYTKYFFCPKEYLHIPYRQRKLQQLIKFYKFDIFCLQELSMKLYDVIKKGYFDIEGEGKVYQSIYKQITKKKIWEGDEKLTKFERESEMEKKEHKEGVSVFFDEKKFEFVEKFEIEFNKYAYDEVKSYSNDIIESFINKTCLDNHNVALCVVLKVKATGEYILISTIHANYRRSDWISQTYQLDILFNEIKKIQNEFPNGHKNEELKHVIICGDFNITHNDRAYKFIKQKKYKKVNLINIEHSLYSIINRNPKHDLKLSECYTSKELKPFTHYSSKLRELDSVDYIFINENVKVSEILEIPSIDKKFPNSDYYSDHLLIGSKVLLL